MTLSVAPVSYDEYLGFVADRPVSLLQCPSWAAVKPEWGSDRLGWRDASGQLIGVGLVLYAQLPVLRRPLAFLAEGPVVDWSRYSSHEVTEPLIRHVRGRRVISLRMGPDLVLHRWHAATLKPAVGEGRRLGDVTPDRTDPVAARLVEDLTAGGWSRARDEDGLYGSFRHAFLVELTGRTPQDLQTAMNQQWRRGIRKAEKAGVVVSRGGFDDLADFYRVYVQTAERDHFTPQPLAYFQRAWSGLSAEDPGRIRLYLGRHEGEVLAGMLVVTVGGLAGYAYGGSASHKREVYPSNAVHWQILRDLLAEGVDTYDMRGVSDTLDPERPKFGVLRFKMGTGGDAVEHIGDWHFPVHPPLHRAFMTALSLRAAARALRARRAALRTAMAAVRSRPARVRSRPGD
jgi:lipid II:glycine glycyltransferase (peptidoglycan interpeptide bridge formation enzyme)